MSHVETPSYRRTAGNLQFRRDAVHGVRIVSTLMFLTFSFFKKYEINI